MTKQTKTLSELRAIIGFYLENDLKVHLGIYKRNLRKITFELTAGCGSTSYPITFATYEKLLAEFKNSECISYGTFQLLK